MRGSRITSDEIGAASRTVVIIVGALMWGWLIWQLSAHHTEREVNAAHYSRQQPKSADNTVTKACGGTTGAAMVECVVEQVATRRENERAEYDLQAQQDSADAAFFMAIVSALTLIATLAALWFVKGTLEATREAVKDTGKATEAMVRANEIAHTSQRPWVSIRVVFNKLCRTGAAISFDFDILFRNHGPTVARGYAIRHKLIFPDPTKPYATLTERTWQAWKKPEKIGRAALMPGEEDIFQSWSHQNEDSLPWHEHDGIKTIAAIVVVSVFYRSDFDDQWHRTDRAFSLGMRGAKLIEDFITGNFEEDVGPDRLVARPFSMALAT